MEVRKYVAFDDKPCEKPFFKVSMFAGKFKLYFPGKLKCSGQSKDSTALVSTCSSLKKSGLSSNGFYLTKVCTKYGFRSSVWCLQDSAEDEVSVNYCQLSSPGYKEEQLRREEVGLDIFSKMEEITFVSYSVTGGRDYYRRELFRRENRNVRFYDVTNIQFEPNTSVYFDITDSYLVAKQTGLYAFHSQEVQMTIDDKWISNNDDTNYIMASVALVKKGQKIKFKVATDRNTHVKGTTLTIYKVK